MGRALRHLALAVIVATAAACTDFLTVEPADELSRADLLGTAAGADAAVVGLYNLLGSPHYYRETMAVYGDVPANLTLGAEGIADASDLEGERLRYALLHARPAPPATYTTLAAFYQDAYEILFQANDVLAALDSLTEGPAEQLASLRGEALAVRALVHHDLLRVFAQAPAFAPDASHAGVALILAPPAIEAQPARATVAEGYAAVRADLREAERLLADGRSRRSDAPLWIDQTVVRGLLARVAAYARDYEAAYEWADRCLAGAAAPLLSREDYVDAWIDDEVTEAFWQLDLQREAQSDGDADLDSPARVVGAGQERPYLQVAPELLAAYAAGDLRRELYAADEEGQLLSRKWPSVPGQLRNPTLLRRSEVVLLRAEAAAETGRLEQALADLSVIALRANPDAPLPPLEQDALRQNIRQERRRELAVEGHHFFDLGRWGADLVREDCSAFVTPCTFTYPDYRYVLPIPQEAIVRNPNLAQNPGY